MRRQKLIIPGSSLTDGEFISAEEISRKGLAAFGLIHFALSSAARNARWSGRHSLFKAEKLRITRERMHEYRNRPVNREEKDLRRHVCTLSPLLTPSFIRNLTKI